MAEGWQPTSADLELSLRGLADSLAEGPMQCVRLRNMLAGGPLPPTAKWLIGDDAAILHDVRETVRTFSLFGANLAACQALVRRCAALLCAALPEPTDVALWSAVPAANAAAITDQATSVPYNGPFVAWFAPPAGDLAQKKDSLPPGFVLRPLTHDDCDVVNDNWTYKDSSSIERVRDCIGNRPSCGIEVDGALVAWAVTRTDWSIGLVGVREDHRRKGLARAVVAHLAQAIYARAPGVQPLVFVDPANEPSSRLHESLGFVPHMLHNYVRASFS